MGFYKWIFALLVVCPLALSMTAVFRLVAAVAPSAVIAAKYFSMSDAVIWSLATATTSRLACEIVQCTGMGRLPFPALYPPVAGNGMRGG